MNLHWGIQVFKKTTQKTSWHFLGVFLFTWVLQFAETEIFFFLFFPSPRPLIRPLPSHHMFEHVQKRHRVLFVYVGGESPLKV